MFRVCCVRAQDVQWLPDKLGSARGASVRGATAAETSLLPGLS